MVRNVLAASLVSIVSFSRFACSDESPVRSAVALEPFAVVAPFGPPVTRAELGRIRVLESRASGSGRTIELAFVRLPSTARRPGSPIVWLSGGPGRSGIEDLETPLLPLLFELRRLGDVLVLDQRGTGRSIPRLDCPGAISFPRDEPLRRERVLDALEDSGRRCAELWRARGVELSAYNTRESAEDLEDLRRAVGADRIRVLAGSYGTHLALAAMRAHPDRIERAVLLGLVGPDQMRRLPSSADRGLETIARLARADGGVSSRLPDLLTTMVDLRNRLASRPVTVSVQTPGGTESITLGRFDLEWYTRALLSDRASIARLPAAYAAMAAGDFSEIAATALAWRNPPLPSAVMFAVRCASGSSAARERRIAAERATAILGEAVDLAEARVCRGWGVPPLADEFREPLSSAVPALFVSGTLDGDTPEENTEEVIPGFRNGSRLVVEGAPHALLGIEVPEERAAVVRFLSGERPRTERLRRAVLAFERPSAAARGTLLADDRRQVPPMFGGGTP